MRRLTSLVAAWIVCATTTMHVCAVVIDMKTPGNNSAVPEGVEMILLCTHKSDSDVFASTLVLQHNGEEITLDDSHKNSLGVVSNTIMFHKYEIEKATIDDGGTYTCLEAPGSSNTAVLKVKVIRAFRGNVVAMER